EAGAVISAESGMLAFFDLDHQAGALVQGTATFSGLGNPHAGDAAPGPGIGTLTWASAYEPSAGSTLFIELGAVDHDRLETGGSATLDGTLHLDFPGLYAPRVGDAFEIVSTFAVCGALSRAFAAAEAPVGFAFHLAYAPTSVTATVADEPDVVVRAATEEEPAVIPPGGGALPHAVRLANTTAQPQAVDAWAEAVLPGGNVVPVGRRTLTLPAAAVVTRQRRLQVPPSAPAGAYEVRVYVGPDPDGVLSADAFAFEKAAPEAAPAGAPAGASAPAGGPLAWRVAETGEDAFALVADGAAAATAAEATAAAGEALPAAFALHAAYPNPSAGRATLRYDLPSAAHVRLAVYDVLGREVAVLVDAEVEAGRHRVAFDGGALAAGVYVVRMTAGAEAFTQTLTLVE